MSHSCRGFLCGSDECLTAVVVVVPRWCVMIAFTAGSQLSAVQIARHDLSPSEYDTAISSNSAGSLSSAGIAIWQATALMRGRDNTLLYLIFIYLVHFYHHFYTPAQPVIGFTPSHFLDKNLRHRCLSFSPPVLVLVFIARGTGFGIPTFQLFCFPPPRRFHRFFANTRSSCVVCSSIFTQQEKVLMSTSIMHSVRLEPATLTILRTRFTSSAPSGTATWVLLAASYGRCFY